MIKHAVGVNSNIIWQRGLKKQVNNFLNRKVVRRKYNLLGEAIRNITEFICEDSTE